MKIMVFDGKVGHHEQYIGCFDFDIVPNIGDLIYLPNDDDTNVIDGNMYIVKQIVNDIVHHEYNMYVRLYDWEG